MTESIVFRKLKRLCSGGRPRVLDLFSGCGGLSLGFEAAGFYIGGAVEFDADAARSHGLNFHDGAEAHSQAIDITETTPAQLCEQLGLESVADAFDVIVGGPPCQAFARVGRSKLREIEEHPEAFIHDPRAQLYKPGLESALKNIQKEFERRGLYGFPQLSSNTSTERQAEALADHLVDIGLRQRRQDNRYTGEWFVFAEQGGEKYYLCIASHNTPDSEIRSAIDKYCVPQFPFLLNVLKK